MNRRTKASSIQLPKAWPRCARSAMLHVISLAQYAAVYTRSWAADSRNSRVRLKAENDRLKQEVAMQRAEIRIKDARMRSIPPHRRPFYQPAERMEILQLRAARGWSLEQTADVFLVTPATIASWMNRLDEEGPDALVQLRTPVNRFPHYVRYAVQRVKALCPTLGKKKLAEVLARAGLHLGATTIGRIQKEMPKPPTTERSTEDAKGSGRVVTAKRPNHVWHVDLTTLPTPMGFWCSWLPCALPQCWPFCGWLAIVVDHYSRRVMGFALFWSAPTAVEMRTFLGRVIRSNISPPSQGRARGGRAAYHARPKYIITDKGCQFWPSSGYKKWCMRHGIKARWGAIGKHGSIAVVERLIKTMKEQLSHFRFLPLRRDDMRRLVASLVNWHNEFRPHTTLNGCTPNERYFGCFPANRRPRIEPRPQWPRGSPCARPHALVSGKPGAKFDVEVEHLGGHRQLPVIRLRRAA